MATCAKQLGTLRVPRYYLKVPLNRSVPRRNVAPRYPGRITRNQLGSLISSSGSSPARAPKKEIASSHARSFFSTYTTHHVLRRRPVLDSPEGQLRSTSCSDGSESGSSITDSLVQPDTDRRLGPSALASSPPRAGCHGHTTLIG
eukprot:1923122-Rhodomonas_salina.2